MLGNIDVQGKGTVDAGSARAPGPWGNVFNQLQCTTWTLALPAQKIPLTCFQNISNSKKPNRLYSPSVGTWHNKQAFNY